MRAALSHTVHHVTGKRVHNLPIRLETSQAGDVGVPQVEIGVWR
jgi:hypothetical protein